MIPAAKNTGSHRNQRSDSTATARPTAVRASDSSPPWLLAAASQLPHSPSPCPGMVDAQRRKAHSAPPLPASAAHATSPPHPPHSLRLEPAHERKSHHALCPFAHWLSAYRRGTDRLVQLALCQAHRREDAAAHRG